MLSKMASSMFNDKHILITGGTGSFGKACIAYLLAHYTPKKIIILSRDEFKQFEMQQHFDDPCMRYLLGDVRDAERLRQAFEEVDYVIHAAALKQVPALEYNPMEAVRTNIMGAENVIRAAIDCGVKKVIALSTDKAANPINLYGATKLASDKLFVAANNTIGSKVTEFSVVRYGNVLGSRGSVIPFFQKLIDEGADSLPITDERMTRFWITLEQGVAFVIKNFARMQGGEVFVPKIPSMNIMDLANAMAPDMPTHSIGIRPGEKLHEIMCPIENCHHTLAFDDHYVIAPDFNFARQVDFSSNAAGESGALVADGFEYHSGTNPEFLTIDAMRELLSNHASRAAA